MQCKTAYIFLDKSVLITLAYLINLMDPELFEKKNIFVLAGLD